MDCRCLFSAGICRVRITNELSALIVAARREGHDFLRETDQVFRFAGKEDHSVVIIAVVERPDPDRVAGGYILLLFGVINDAGKFGIEHSEHIGPVLTVQGKDDLAVAVACK